MLAIIKKSTTPIETGTLLNLEPSGTVSADPDKGKFDPNFGKEMAHLSKSYITILKNDSKLGKDFDQMSPSRLSQIIIKPPPGV